MARAVSHVAALSPERRVGWCSRTCPPRTIHRQRCDARSTPTRLIAPIGDPYIAGKHLQFWQLAVPSAHAAGIQENRATRIMLASPHAGCLPPPSNCSGGLSACAVSNDSRGLRIRPTASDPVCRSWMAVTPSWHRSVFRQPDPSTASVYPSGQASGTVIAATGSHRTVCRGSSPFDRHLVRRNS